MAPQPHQEYLKAHAELLCQDEWIIDGYGGVATAWARFAKADTLVYVDLPLIRHGWRVPKRLIKGLFADPPGWPENSPLWGSTMNSYRVYGLAIAGSRRSTGSLSPVRLLRSEFTT